MINIAFSSLLSLNNQFNFMGLNAGSTSRFSLVADSLCCCAVALTSCEYDYQVMMFVTVLMEGIVKAWMLLVMVDSLSTRTLKSSTDLYLRYKQSK